MSFQTSAYWTIQPSFFTADHGTLLGEHGLYEKHPHHYDEELRVPLMRAFPPLIPPGTRYKGMVQLVDIFPTLADLAGLETPATIHGQSLIPMTLNPSEPGKSMVFSEGGGGNLVRPSCNWDLLDKSALGRLGFGWEDRRRACVRTHHWKLVVYNWRLPGKEVQLFNLAADPKEEHDLSRNREMEPVRGNLWSLIEAWHRSCPWHHSLGGMLE